MQEQSGLFHFSLLQNTGPCGGRVDTVRVVAGAEGYRQRTEGEPTYRHPQGAAVGADVAVPGLCSVVNDFSTIPYL